MLNKPIISRATTPIIPSSTPHKVTDRIDPHGIVLGSRGKHHPQEINNGCVPLDWSKQTDTPI